MTPPRLWRSLAVYLAVMAGLVWLTPWRNADWTLFAWLPRGAEVRLRDEHLGLIDVDHSEDRGVYRRRIAALLGTLASGQYGRPRAVVLDIQIGPETVELDALACAIVELRNQGTKVYAAVYLVDPNRPSEPNPEFMKAHASQLYVELLDGFGHTEIQHRRGTAMYEAYREVRPGEWIASLPVRLAIDLSGLRPESVSGPQLIDLGPSDDLRSHSHRFVDGRFDPAEARRGTPRFDDHVLIVGSPRTDRFNPRGGRCPEVESDRDCRSGPEMLLWATQAQMQARANPTAAAILASPELLVGLTAAFSLLAAYLTRQAMLRHTPWRIARSWRIPAAGLAVTLGAAVGLVLLLPLVKHVYAQWTLVIAGAAAASLLTWRFDLAEDIWNLHQGRILRAPRHNDVFVSYRHQPPENAEWVRRQVVELLKTRARCPDGKRVDVFFDRHSIEAGDDWHDRIEVGIRLAKVFVPVYSPTYFDSPVCREEMVLARKRHAQEPFIVPVSRLAPQDIPADDAALQCLDASSDAPFGDALVRKVQELVAVTPS